MADEEMTAEQHFEELCRQWQDCMETMRNYLQGIDGKTSRQIGQIVYDIVEKGPSYHPWPEVGTALFIKHDSFLWHEVADGRKK